MKSIITEALCLNCLVLSFKDLPWIPYAIFSFKVLHPSSILASEMTKSLMGPQIFFQLVRIWPIVSLLTRMLTGQWANLKNITPIPKQKRVLCWVINNTLVCILHYICICICIGTCLYIQTLHPFLKFRFIFNYSLLMMSTIPHENTVRITATVKGNLYYPQMYKIMYLTTPLRKESNALLHKRTLLALDN